MRLCGAAAKDRRPEESRVGAGKSDNFVQVACLWECRACRSGQRGTWGAGLLAESVGHEARIGPRTEPGVSLTNRERRAAASDPHNARVVGTFFQSLSGLPGGRPGGVYVRVAV